MNVKELIEKLSTLPEDLPVLAYAHESHVPVMFVDLYSEEVHYDGGYAQPSLYEPEYQIPGGESRGFTHTCACGYGFVREGDSWRCETGRRFSQEEIDAEHAPLTRLAGNPMGKE